MYGFLSLINFLRFFRVSKVLPSNSAMFGDLGAPGSSWSDLSVLSAVKLWGFLDLLRLPVGVSDNNVKRCKQTTYASIDALKKASISWLKTTNPRHLLSSPTPPSPVILTSPRDPERSRRGVRASGRIATLYPVQCPIREFSRQAVERRRPRLRRWIRDHFKAKTESCSSRTKRRGGIRNTRFSRVGVGCRRV